MEDSFFEYRDKTDDVSESDSEIIDNSFVDNSLSTKKTPVVKNKTLFIAESDESGLEAITDEDEIREKDKIRQNPKLRRSHLAEPHLILSSDDDGSRRGSIRRQSENSNKVVLSSSDEESQSSAGDVSPELVPRKRLPRPKSKGTPSNSLIRLKSKKRMLRIDSDTEDSIVIEHDKNRKVTCLKDTPLKIDCGKKVIQYSDEDMSNASDDDKVSSNMCTKSYDDHASNVDETSEVEDDGPDEDQMVMSRATRMSIMGFLPKDNDSDESDFIHSEDSQTNSQGGSTNSLNDLPDVSVALHKSPLKDTEPNNDTTTITCSPFSSPLKDITNADDNLKTKSKIDSNVHVVDIDEKDNEFSSPKNKVLIDLVTEEIECKEDDDVTIIDSKPEIIALSSDDEFEVKDGNKSPNVKKSPKRPVKVKNENDSEKPKDNTIRQYLVPPSYPNQVVYVQKEVRENELRKLQGLHEDLLNIRNLLDNMDVTTLPDGGVKLIERLTALESSVRLQGDKVANMVVEPDAPTPEDIARDGFDKGLSWDAIQSASNAVQPRMFGKQAMATHLSERNVILERLRDLHTSLDSCPPESTRADSPRALVTDLMPHQLRALAWLRWRETQRPCGGILADDMGLGKTITMISLILSDKENHIENGDDDDVDDFSRGNAKLVRGGTLVVCPASLMQQWAGEVRKHCRPNCLVVCAHHGTARAKMPHRLAANDLVLTTYNILQRDNERNGVLVRVAWNRVILDEAHTVRNHKSATSIAVCALRARRRWALTGTPIHNKDLDLFALMKFLVVTPFDELQMWKKWIDNKSSGGQERLNTIMQCILLRRTKAQLQQRGQLTCLPARTAHSELVTLTQPEMNVYQKVLVFSKTLFAQFLHQRAEKSANAHGYQPPEKDSAYAKMHKKMIALQGAKPIKSHEILVLLLRLRQVCCHCGLIAAMLDGREDVDEDPAGQDLLAELDKLSLEEKSGNRKSGQKEEEEKPQEEASVAEAIRSVLSPNNPVFKLTRPSSKITAVMDCLKNNVFSKPGEKAVVVSQWTAVLGLVERELSKMRVRSVTLSGAVPVSARATLIDAFNGPTDVRVMLLSLCAGGVGLNLCGGNHLLLLDPHWNPQLEEQAQDRIYRVGQLKDVHIYRFMCVDTVEQTIRKLQEAKLELAENVLTGARHTNASKLSIEDLKMLFNMN